MVDYRQRHTADWLEYFAHRGYPAVQPLAAGIEGAVYSLGEEVIAKVWSGRPPVDLDLIRQVNADIARHHLSFATPEILKIEEHDGVLITYERKLTGSPLGSDSAVEQPNRDLASAEVAAILSVLSGLAAVPGTEAMRSLTIQGDDRPLWLNHTRFPDALAALVERATRRHRDLLAAHISDLSVKIVRTVEALKALPDTPVTVIHGDLIPPNIHVDDTGRPTAILDFGFFTTAGDPAFEAAVTAAIWDMYGPHADEHLATLTKVFATELRYAPETLALYQTAYALTTYDLFASDGTDGHFRWCVGLLNRTSF